MFYDLLLKRRIAKCLVWVMMLTNVSPAFGVGFDYVDYSIQVERRIRLDPITKNEELGIQLSVHEFDGKGYRSILDRFLSPFTNLASANLPPKHQPQLPNPPKTQPQLTEVLEKINVKITQPQKEEGEYYEIGKKTDVSRGYALNIPEIGDILVSHDGDIVFNSSTKKIQKTLEIRSPSHVILNNARAEKIQVKATAAYLTGKSQAEIGSLKFEGTGEAGNLSNGLFVENGSELKVRELDLENALLINAGNLSVGKAVNLNRGCVLNSGNLSSSADNSVFENISYMFNSSKGAINSSGKLILGVDNFANLGTFKSENLNMVVSDSFRNSGTIESTKKAEISVIGDAINSGKIDGKSGDLVISAPKFFHESNVSISASKLDFRTEDVELLGDVRAQEAVFRGQTKIGGNVHIGRGVISDGLFINKSEEANFEKLELIGKKTEIRNEGKIVARAILGNATINLISGKDIAVNELQATQHTEVTANLPVLTSVSNAANSKLLIGEKVAAPKLKKVKNAGLMSVTFNAPELEDINNSTSGELLIKTAVPLTKVTKLDLGGKVNVKAELPKLQKINVQDKGSLLTLPGTKIGKLESVDVHSGAILKFGEDTKIEKVNDVRNFGQFTSNTPLKMDSLYNAPSGFIDFHKHVDIKSRGVKITDQKAIPAMARFPHKKIGLFNEGMVTINLGHSYKPGQKFQGVSIDGDYVASKNAIFFMKNGGLSRVDTFNDGEIRASGKITGKIGKTQSKHGKVIANGSIDMDISPKASVSSSYNPMILGENKSLELKSSTEFILDKPINWEVDAKIKAPKVSNMSSDVVLRSLEVQSENFENKGKIRTQNNIDIKAQQTFRNDGILESHAGSANIKTKDFENKGRIATQKDVDIKTQKVMNRKGGFLGSNGKITLNADEEIVNEGQLETQNDLGIYTKKLKNQDDGVIKTNGKINFHGRSFGSSSDELENRGLVESKNDTAILTKKFSNEKKGVFRSNRSVTVKSGEVFKNVGQILTQEGIDVQMQNVNNGREGVLESHGAILINAKDSFENSGGGYIREDEEKFDKYFWEGGCSFRKEEQVFYRDVYELEPEKAGKIAAGKFVEIVTGKFNNSFGVINATERLQIKSKSEVLNESGLIYCGGFTLINGSFLKNGYSKGSESVWDDDRDRPIYETRRIEYQEWISSGYHRASGGFFGGLSGKRRWVDTSHYETRYRDEEVKTGYRSRIRYTTASKYPGYIFSQGDLDINMDSQAYFGTIVSGGNIKIKGASQENINSKDRGLVIARGDINVELQKAWNNLTMQARNIGLKILNSISLLKCMFNRDENFNKSDKGERKEKDVIVIDVKKLSRYYGFGAPQSFSNITDGSSSKNIKASSTITRIIPLNSSPQDMLCSLYPTESVGFTGNKPETPFFISSVQDSILNQIIKLTLTPIHGRDILLNIDLIGTLIKAGKSVEKNFYSNQSMILRDGDPAILYKEAGVLDFEEEKEGKKYKVSICDPLIVSILEPRIRNGISAEHLLTIGTQGKLDVRSEKLEFDVKHLTFQANERIDIFSDYNLSETNNRIGINKSKISNTGDITLSGDKGVSTEAVEISARNLTINSEQGDITDKGKQLDPQYVWHGDHITYSQKNETSTFMGKDSVHFSAATVDLEGTTVNSGEGGTNFESKIVKLEPAYEDAGYFRSHSKGYVNATRKVPKATVLQSSGPVIFNTQNATLIGAQVIAPAVLNPTDGLFSVVPAYTTQHVESFEVKNRFLGSSSRRVTQDQSLVQSANITTKFLKSLGVGDFEIKSAIIRATEAYIQKNIIEQTAYDTSSTNIVNKSSGFGAPKINGDPIIKAISALNNIQQANGDVLPTVCNFVGTAAKTARHALTLANLNKNSNPFEAVTSILLDRFVVGPILSNSKTTIDRKEKIPHQSNVQIGVLRADNSRTHLEGIWNINGKERSYIKTEDFSIDSPKTEVKQSVKSKGWSLSFAASALTGLALGFAGATAANCLQNISLIQSDAKSLKKSVYPMALNADDLLVVCDNAVFRGAKIHARFLEVLVSKDLTIETLKNEFRSDSHGTNIGLKLDSLQALMSETRSTKGFFELGLQAAPQLRIANERHLSEKIGEISELVGREKFYLTVGKLLHKIGAIVGLEPDGVVSKNEKERIKAKEILEEKVREAEKHERHVFNPSVAEFVSMMSEVDAFKRIQAQVELEELKEGISAEQREKDKHEIKKFLEQPKVKEAYEKLQAARAKLQAAKQKRQSSIEKISRLGPTLDPTAANSTAATNGNNNNDLKKTEATANSKSLALAQTEAQPIGAVVDPNLNLDLFSYYYSSDSQDPTQQYSNYSLLNSLFIEYSLACEEVEVQSNEIVGRMADLNEFLDDLVDKHPNLSKCGEIFLKYLGIAGAAVGAIALPEVGLAATISGITGSMAYGELFEYLVENGSDKFVEYCAQQGRTEDEAIRYGSAAAGIANKVLMVGGIRSAVKTLVGGKKNLGTAKKASKIDVSEKSVQAFREKALNSRVREISWGEAKAKIFGKAQKTGTEGHDIQSMKLAIHEAYKKDVKTVFLDTSLKKITNEQVNSKMRPDVTVVRTDNKIITHEVISKSQHLTQLKNKIQKMQEMLPESQRAPESASVVFDVEGKAMK